MSARILIVDDLAPNLHLLQAKLAAEYYDVLTARNGEEAVKIAATEKLDLVLMDAMMPGMNGFEACSIIKGDPNTWHVPVIMVTALELKQRHEITIETDPVKAITTAKGNFDIIVVSLFSDMFDGLRICASIRFNQESRDTPILVIDAPENEARLLRAYDIGINDTVMRPVETQEFLARINSQLRRKFYADTLLENFNESMDMVVSDPLTGLGNRRYFERATDPLIEALEEKETPFTTIIFDIDHFKRVNDILGHDMGDHILKEVSARLVTNMRAIDVVSRYGGEEFMIAMPHTNEAEGILAADRIRSLIAGTPIYVNGEALTVTVSAGVAQVSPGDLAQSKKPLLKFSPTNITKQTSHQCDKARVITVLALH